MISKSQRKIAITKDTVVVIGTGVSIALTDNQKSELSWIGLVENGLSSAHEKGFVTDTQLTKWKSHLDSDDIDDLLTAAEFMGRKLGAPTGDLYQRWFQDCFSGVIPTNSALVEAIKQIAKSGVKICTLNYDTLIEDITGLQSISMNNKSEVVGWMRDETKGVLHLHGIWKDASSCILGVREYQSTINDEIRDFFQRSLCSFENLLFIGCGETFSDPNFRSLISWMRKNLQAASPHHVALVLEKDLASRAKDPNWLGFVKPTSYGLGHSDLGKFLQDMFTDYVQNFSSTGEARPENKKDNECDVVISEYRDFLLKDCGQMTIEGVRADMDTAQRKFEIEKLFVPLKLVPCPPVLSPNDLRAEKKIAAWKKRAEVPIDFAKIFKKNKRLALLALPGGGKTLLLKRLAVAYAELTRLKKGKDGLPDLNLLPILIRCREWRDFIHLPIPTLLKKLPEITGNNSLSGLDGAIQSLLASGDVLLLVDGLDEIHDDAKRTIFVGNLESFIESYPQIRVVITSREAGFDLVAPSISRFCEKWRVSGFEDKAIETLCLYWQTLMVGSSPESVAEGRMVASYLVSSVALKRLAENPLLLTMLLVVKHGAGRLPPDRVSLYARAVEVLLDTWNIKGHDALNLKESVPQLAYIAYEMMRKKKQTATEIELLELLETARENVPQIRRYAKDTPHSFLKRVELRSSLLLEAGHQVENGATVPFYQFRHLTFQEYLAAVAVVEGHYIGYRVDDNIVTPIGDVFLSEEWKEVIPMTAVIARKQSEPLILRLIEEGRRIRDAVQSGEKFVGYDEWISHRDLLPSPIARLVQCFIEEAEASPETLAEALGLIAFFCRGCRSDEDWGVLCKGPYGRELRHQMWILYEPMKWPEETNLFYSYEKILARSIASDLPNSANFASFEADSMDWLQSETVRLFSFAIKLREFSHRDRDTSPRNFHNALLETCWSHVLSKDPVLYPTACYVLAVYYSHFKKESIARSDILDTLLQYYLHGDSPLVVEPIEVIFSSNLGLRRETWTPKLTSDNVLKLREKMLQGPRLPSSATSNRIRYTDEAIAMIAFHSKEIFSETDLVDLLEKGSINRINTEKMERVVKILKKNLTSRST